MREGVGRTREQKILNEEIKVEKRKALLAALEKATQDEPPFSVTGISTNPADSYYTLSPEEKDALLNGDMSKIESWVSNLDKDHATRLLRWLLKEGW